MIYLHSSSFYVSPPPPLFICMERGLFLSTFPTLSTVQRRQLQVTVIIFARPYSSAYSFVLAYVSDRILDEADSNPVVFAIIISERIDR